MTTSLGRARALHVEKGLKESWKKEVDKDSRMPFEVFCVDNELYRDSAQDQDIEGIRDSGIPQLRQAIHDSSAKARRAKLLILESKLRSIRDSIHLYVSPFIENDKYKAFGIKLPNYNLKVMKLALTIVTCAH